MLREDKTLWALWPPSDNSLLGFRSLGGESRAFLASKDEKGKTETPDKSKNWLSLRCKSTHHHIRSGYREF